MGNMRVIAGSRRHLLLKTVPDLSVRPTEDRTKETLFNVLAPYIPGSSFLDLFSGSGAIGIEALSLGAEKCVMVEMAKASLDCIKDNLKTTKFIDDARLLSMDVFDSLELLEKEKKSFDVIFMDPPYNKELERRVLEKLSHSSLINDDTIIVCEASNQTAFDYVGALGFDIIKEKIYKNNKHVFFRKVTADAV